MVLVSEWQIYFHEGGIGSWKKDKTLTFPLCQLYTLMDFVG